MGISKKAMAIMDNLMKDIFHRMAAEAGKLVKKHGRTTMNSRDMMYATK